MVLYVCVAVFQMLFCAHVIVQLSMRHADIAINSVHIWFYMIMIYSLPKKMGVIHCVSFGTSLKMVRSTAITRSCSIYAGILLVL